MRRALASATVRLLTATAGAATFPSGAGASTPRLRHPLPSDTGTSSISWTGATISSLRWPTRTTLSRSPTSPTTSSRGRSGGLLGATWTSAPIPVTAGERYDLAMSFAGVAPSVSVAFLDKTGALLSTVPLTPSLLSGTLGARVDVPAGASALKIGVARAPTLQTGETTWVDDVWLW